jgi:hypothetical protein
LDDATGEIYSAFLVAEEGTHSTLRALHEVTAQHGLPCSLYTNRGSHYRGSHYFVTPKTGEKPDPRPRRSAGRWRSSASSTPRRFRPRRGAARNALSARFRTASPRSSRRPPSRPPPRTLSARGICPSLQRTLCGAAGTARLGLCRDRDLDRDQILCVESRAEPAPAQAGVGNDNTVLWRRRRLQIPASPLRPHFVRARVKVRQHLDGTLSIFHGPRCITRYGPEGQAIAWAA